MKGEPKPGWGNPHPYGKNDFHYFGEDNYSICREWFSLSRIDCHNTKQPNTNYCSKCSNRLAESKK